MIIAGMYSFNSGREVIEAQCATELREVDQIIAAVDSAQCRTKTNREKTMPGKSLYSLRALNQCFKQEFEARDWRKHKVHCEYPTEYYAPGYIPDALSKRAFREIDFVKNRVGVEVQIERCTPMVYSGCAKMTIFQKLDVIDVGIEIVPLKAFADDMSTGVSYFEQFVWDLEHRGIADIDIPVLILGVAA
jgi:hypothetical protein